MTTTDTDTSVRKTVTVNTPIDRAFDVFIAGFNTWWPRTHHIATVDMAEAIIEPRVGGRWYERGIDGSECEWGTVLDYDRPNHVALSWRLNGEFQYDPDPEHQSRIDVRFERVSADVTRVDLVHSQLDRHGETWKALREGISGEGGWPSLLQMFATEVAA
jgi:uncharacterized protein YndB with AHSA1/START domain